MTEGPTFPFAFFGAEPMDWFDLTDDLFSYELRFEKAPDAGARAAIAAAWEEGINPRSLEIARPFVWASRWALARVRPAGWNRKSIVEMARSVQEALRRVHEAWPLEEATLAEALESDSEWDAWSIAERAGPTTGPKWPVALPKTGAGERFEAACTEDAEAERAREEVRSARAEKEAAMEQEAPADDGSDDDGEGDEEKGTRSRSDGPRVTEGDISIVRPKAGDVPRKLEVSPSQQKLFGSRPEAAVTPSGRVFGVGKPRRQPKQAAFIEDGELQPIAGEPLPDAYAGYLAAREDSASALIGFDYNSVWEIDFAERRIRRLFKQGESLADLAYGPDGRIIALTSDSLDVFRREGDGATLEQRWSIDGYGVRSARGGRLLFVSCFEGGDDGITVFGFSGSSLRRLARVVFSVSEILVSNGRVFVEDLDEDGNNYAEITGLDELLERLDASPEAFAEAPVNTEKPAEAIDEEGSGESEDEDEDNDGDGDGDGDGDSDSDGDSDDESDDDESDDDDDENDDDENDDDESDDESDDDESDDDDEEEKEKARPPARTRKGASSFTVEPGPGKVGLEHLGRRSPLEELDEPEIPRDVKSRFGTGSEVKVTPDGSLYYGWKKEGRQKFRFAALVQGHFIETEATSKSSSELMTVRWDRRQIVAASDGDKKLWSIELPQGRATLIHDFSGEEYDDEVYGCLPLAFDRVFVTTSSDAWVFSLAKGAPALEMRGELDVQSFEPACDGRAIVFETTDGKLLRVWGVFEDGICELAGFDLQPSEIDVREGRVLVKASGGLGWFELLGIEDTWAVARREGGARYPRVELKKEASSDDDDENDDDDDENDDDDS